jgi:sulfur relay (sulfurtransferase) DsrF/TusC family protein
MATCQIKKGVLFFLSEGPYATDRNFHLVRMALSIALDAKPQLVLVDDGVRLSVCTQEPSLPLNDVVSQLRLLREMEVSIYVVEEDLTERGIAKEEIIPGFTVLPKDRVGVVMDEASYFLVA